MDHLVGSRHLYVNLLLKKQAVTGICPHARRIHRSSDKSRTDRHLQACTGRVNPRITLHRYIHQKKS